MESIPDHRRHGPADVEFPPPGGPWEPLALNGRLVGWAERAGLGLARRSVELGQQLAEDHRAYLLTRLGHKLRSAVLALQESARQAAFGRPELLEAVFEQAALKYGDVKLPFGGTVGENANMELFAIRHLAVGKEAAEIEGPDQNGVRFKLSDYRGKVVLLYFWQHV